MHKLDPLSIPLDGIKLIEASAGTGKTYTIATLYLRLLIEKGLSVREILVVTFTNAATEELRDRIRDKLRHAIHLLSLGESAIGDEEDEVLRSMLLDIADPKTMIQHLVTELTCIDEAAIHTIHGFSQRMLLDNAFESGSLFETEFLQSEDELLDEVVRDYWRQHFYTASAGLAAQVQIRWGTPLSLKQEIRDYLYKPFGGLLPQLDETAVSEAAYHELYQKLEKLWTEWETSLCESIETAASERLLSIAEKNYRADTLEAAIEEMRLFMSQSPEAYTLPWGFTLFTQSHLDSCVDKRKARKGLQAPQHEFFHLCDELQQLVENRLIAIQQQAIRWCREELAGRKESAALLSYNDLLTQLRTALVSEQGEALAAHIVQRYPYAMIDEFQDTDPEQYQIFESIYGRHPHVPENSGFYMIGDPKQAIYSFRGADIFTYMLAKDNTQADAQFTLDTNWRSSSTLIRAINALYEQSRAPFIYQGHIDYHRVEPSPRADATQLHVEGDTDAALRCWFLERSEARTEKNRLTKKAIEPEIAQACANECARLLNLGKQGRAHIGDEAVQPHHLAILVRDRFEADKIRLALRQKGIGSAYYSRDSVFASEEALQLLMLLQSINEPGDVSLLRAALSSPLIALSAEELDALLQNDLEWEQRLGQIHHYHQEWLNRGFMPMFRRVLHEQAIAHRLLGYHDGERRLTNLLQLGELVQAASREHEGMENQLRWLNEQIENPDGNLEDQRLRLESDDALVKVVNIHTSKGLEYPVVFLPFIWSSKARKKNQPLYVHDESDPSMVTLDLSPDEASYEQAEKERLAEDLRLLYVAFTRAKYRCYFSYGYVTDVEKSALAWLLHGEASEQPLADLAAQLNKAEDDHLYTRLMEVVHASDGSFALAPLPGHQPSLSKALPEHDRLSARTATRPIHWHWRMTSYSGLTASHSAAPVSSEFRETGRREEDAELIPGAEEDAMGLDLFHFPKGARAGTFMHGILEELDFAGATEETINEEVARQRQRYGYDEKWQKVIEGMVHQTLDTPLNETGLTLRQLSTEQRLVELEFQYPIQQLKAAGLNRLIEAISGDNSGHALEFEAMSGIMRGFIDLTFEHEGRYYIADYKSNWLGNRIEDYTRERLQQVIFEHRYDLQYLIYSLALHRYLGANLQDYNYENHFGGVYYLFLRGMNVMSGQDKGIFYDRPSLEVIERLDRLMRGEA
ncbi:MAG: exodeoxyribonuclease V subunit beta [Gammaproteobacteria bacterium]|nr:exodeoxyribonuclease V subunit beta [Gammaproteobacteria bacterium]